MSKVILVSTCQYCGQAYGVKIIDRPLGNLVGLVDNERIKTFGICDSCMIAYHINLVKNKTVSNLMGKE